MSVKQHNFTFRLDNNTHHPALAVVNDLLHGVLEFGLAFFADGGDFGADAVLDELFDGFAEDVGFPDAFAALATLADVLDKVVGLLLGAYDRGVSMLALIMWMDGLLERIFTPNLLPWRMTVGSSIWISESSGTTTP